MNLLKAIAKELKNAVGNFSLAKINMYKYNNNNKHFYFISDHKT